MKDRILSFISLAQKAGKIASGQFLCEKALKEGKAFAVIIAGDASENTKKHFKDMCAYRNISCFEYSDMESLGRTCGKEERSVMAVCDTGFADNIKRLLAEVES